MSTARPTGTSRGLLSMTWRDVLFDHWLVPPETVETRLPPSLEVDTFEDDAYRGDVDREPWSLRPARAEFVENRPFEASGFDRPGGELTLRVAEPVEVTAGWLRRT